MRWSGWLFDNMGLKVFALLLAILLYLHVYTDRPAEEVVYFPIQLLDLPDTLALAKDAPAEVGARLRGIGKQVIRLKYVKPPVRVSLAGVSPGTFQRPFTAADVPLTDSPDVVVLEIVDPPQLTLEITRRAHRRLPVAAALVGTPARGFAVSGRPLIRPSLVRLAGPTEWIAQQETLRTEPINVAGRRDTLEVVQALTPPPDWALAVPGSVLVSVPIEAEVSRSYRTAVEVRSIRPELRAEVHPPAVTLSWRGPGSLASRLDESDFSVRVDVERRGRGEWMLPVRVTGAGSERVIAAPESVRVTLH
jgi:hypothetical protein